MSLTQLSTTDPDRVANLHTAALMRALISHREHVNEVQTWGTQIYVFFDSHDGGPGEIIDLDPEACHAHRADIDFAYTTDVEQVANEVVQWHYSRHLIDSARTRRLLGLRPQRIYSVNQQGIR